MLGGDRVAPYFEVGLLGLGSALLLGLQAVLLGLQSLLLGLQILFLGHVFSLSVSAFATREVRGRDSAADSHGEISSSARRSTPVWMPKPVSIQMRSSVARFPVADLANGQPPVPATAESKMRTPLRKPA